jgi:hypothetical protein
MKELIIKAVQYKEICGKQKNTTHLTTDDYTSMRYIIPTACNFQKLGQPSYDIHYSNSVLA